MRITGNIVVSGGGNITCGNDLLIRAEQFIPVKIHVATDASIIFGDKVFINSRVHISCSTKIRIGTHCDIADECLIIDNDYHDVGNIPAKQAPIIIEDNVWLASRVIVLKGVTIGENSVIGACSLVARNIPKNQIWGGNPIKFIKELEINKSQSE